MAASVVQGRKANKAEARAGRRGRTTETGTAMAESEETTVATDSRMDWWESARMGEDGDAGVLPPRGRWSRGDDDESRRQRLDRCPETGSEVEHRVDRNVGEEAELEKA